MLETGAVGVWPRCMSGGAGVHHLSMQILPANRPVSQSVLQPLVQNVYPFTEFDFLGPQ